MATVPGKEYTKMLRKAGFGGESGWERENTMFRILMAGFKHETNNFNERCTTVEDYRRRALLSGAEMLENYRGTKAEAGAFIDVFSARDDVEIVPVVYADASPGGVVTRETFEYFKQAIVEGYRAADREAKISGIALVLHGAMITDFSEDGEGELLKELREAAGPELPVVATLDYHANMTPEMVKYATALFPARYYPHTDFYERGLEAAQMLLDILDGKAHPAAALRKLPMILPHKDTSEEPLKSMIERMTLESGHGSILYAYFIGGFSRADISMQGSAVYVITENDPDKAEETAQRYYDWILDHLEQFELAVKDPVLAVRDAIASPRLTVIADAADNPGSGLMSDATEIFHELIRQGAEKTAAALVWDPETVEQAFAAGPGAVIHARIAGKSSEVIGAPVEADAYVRSIHDGIFRIRGPMKTGELQNAGRVAVVEAKGITFVLCSNRTQAFDEESFRAFGVEPEDYHIIVVKSSIHYRAAWKRRVPQEDLVTVDMPNLTSFDERKIGFKNVPRPIYPLDSAEEVRKAAGRK